MDLSVIQFWLNLQLLKLAGHSPNLHTDDVGQKLAADQAYEFEVDKMTFRPQPKGSYGQQAIKLLRLGLALESPEPLAKISDLNLVLHSCLQLSKIMSKQVAG